LPTSAGVKLTLLRHDLLEARLVLESQVGLNCFLNTGGASLYLEK
jgi:hypothetical protein